MEFFRRTRSSDAGQFFSRNSSSSAGEGYIAVVAGSERFPGDGVGPTEHTGGTDECQRRGNRGSGGGVEVGGGGVATSADQRRNVAGRSSACGRTQPGVVARLAIADNPGG